MAVRQGTSHAGQAAHPGQWLEVSPHWLRYGEAERAHTAAKQDTATYAVDSAWLGKKFDLLSEPHRKMVLEITRALLRLEGKQ
jgi:hypothetical protein